MAVTRYRRKWKRQPPEGARASHKWVQRGLVALFDCRAGVEVLSGDRATIDTTIRALTEGGRTADFLGSGVQRYPHRAAYALTGEFSLLILCDVDALSNYSPLIAKEATSTTHCPFELRFGAGAGDSLINVVRADATSYGVATGTVNLLPTVPATLARVVVRVPTNSRDPDGTAWVNGVRADFTAITQTGNFVTDNGVSDVWIGGRPDGVTHLDGRIYHIGLMNRAVLAEEAQEFNENPWDVFDPEWWEVPIYSTTPVLTNLLATNIASTTAKLRMTFTVPT